MRKIFQTCKLVHGDLSEFNILYHSGKAYIIDVSQSVEHDHPHALEFLRKDLTNITEFFRKKNVNVLSVKDLFDFVVDVTINDEESKLEELSQKAAEKDPSEITNDDLINEEVFKQVFIPRSLDQVNISFHFGYDLNYVITIY